MQNIIVAIVGIGVVLFVVVKAIQLFTSKKEDQHCHGCSSCQPTHPKKSL